MLPVGRLEKYKPTEKMEMTCDPSTREMTLTAFALLLFGPLSMCAF